MPFESIPADVKSFLFIMSLCVATILPMLCLMRCYARDILEG